jgi:phosphatidylserine/phosphatidylglycerophosphate/cardiolipin synthase-like enzyme
MNNIQTEIISDFKSAKQSIKVAVSWLTDQLLINELILATQKGITVKVIVSSNELNIIRFELFQKLIDLGATVNKEGNEEPEQGKFMHFKFYIIDDNFAKSGSYNFSANAVTNREAMDEVSVTKKINEFDECFKDSVNFFYDIVNPELKRAELKMIEKEQSIILTPEKLAAYRLTQIAIKEQEVRHRKEIELKEQQRQDADAARKRAEENAIREKGEREKIQANQREKEQQEQYGMKSEAPAISEAPPRSYAK